MENCYLNFRSDNIYFSISIYFVNSYSLAASLTRVLRDIYSLFFSLPMYYTLFTLFHGETRVLFWSHYRDSHPSLLKEGWFDDRRWWKCKYISRETKRIDFFETSIDRDTFVFWIELCVPLIFLLYSFLFRSLDMFDSVRSIERNGVKFERGSCVSESFFFFNLLKFLSLIYFTKITYR